MGIGGIALQFLPHEILRQFGADFSGVNALFAQITGALLLGFAMMNWMAKAVLIGGIYARPLALGNFTHFMIAALALIKYAFAASVSPLVWALALVYTIFAALFAYVFFTHPLKNDSAAS
jgi:hypothetical protein